MRLLCDANVGSIIARALADIGHDVVRAIAVTPDADDDVVLAYAVSDARILITCDRDFGELVFLKGATPPPAIVYIRFEPDEVQDVLPRLIPILDFATLDGHMTIIGSKHDRRRPFPAKSDNNG